MLLTTLVDVSSAVGATRSRKEKARLIAELLVAADAGERGLVAHYLSGRLRQRRTGLGWRSLQALPSPADRPSLEVAEVDAAFQAMSELSGPGSAGARTTAATELFARATADEQAWLRAITVGEVRQGALESIVTEALAAAAAVPLAAVRRAAMLAGGATYVVEAAFEGIAALEAVGLTVGRPVLPMLASSATDVPTAIAKAAGHSGEVGVDAKLDGIRIQVHRDGEEVTIATRSLDDITARLPEVVDLVRSLPARCLVLDGEALSLADDGRPRPFQETASRTATRAGDTVVSPYFFDVLHLDGEDLIDRPAHERWEVLERLVPAAHRVRRWVGSSPEEATAFAASVLEDGHEGVVVKSVDAAYDAGRRGAAWVKVKPVHTLDLVVLAVERGSGRRRGWLSNIHLGARDPPRPPAS
ncbi:ATP-dependent DNA ligase [Nocardioides montaniterrae]